MRGCSPRLTERRVLRSGRPRQCIALAVTEIGITGAGLGCAVSADCRRCRGGVAMRGCGTGLAERRVLRSSRARGRVALSVAKGGVTARDMLLRASILFAFLAIVRDRAFSALARGNFVRLGATKGRISRARVRIPELRVPECGVARSEALRPEVAVRLFPFRHHRRRRCPLRARLLNTSQSRCSTPQ